MCIDRALMQIILMWYYVAAFSVMGQSNDGNPPFQDGNVIKSLGITNINKVLPVIKLTNNISIKGVLWGECITNERVFYVSILIKNNGKSAIYVPERTENVYVQYQYRTNDDIHHGYYHTDNNESQYTAYVCLRRNEVKEYTLQLFLIVNDDINDGCVITSLKVKTRHMLSDYDRNIINESGHQCIQNLEYEFKDIRCVKGGNK